MPCNSAIRKISAGSAGKQVRGTLPPVLHGGRGVVERVGHRQRAAKWHDAMSCRRLGIGWSQFEICAYRTASPTRRDIRSRGFERGSCRARRQFGTIRPMPKAGSAAKHAEAAAGNPRNTDKSVCRGDQMEKGKTRQAVQHQTRSFEVVGSGFMVCYVALCQGFRAQGCRV